MTEQICIFNTNISKKKNQNEKKNETPIITMKTWLNEYTNDLPFQNFFFKSENV